VRLKENASSWYPVVQQYVLLIGGILGIAYETVRDHIDRPGLLLVFMAMMGLSSVAAGALGAMSNNLPTFMRSPHAAETPTVEPTPTKGP
jgi:hypothetical protein